MSSHSGAAAVSPFKQPRAVWAVAFACVVSFMGIGLVDPILPVLAEELEATPAQVSLLFTSYLVVTAVAMIGVGWVSSRIGAKWTLILGLVLIVGFAGLAGTAGGVDGIVGFRAGWGLGNALFISTSLAVIVASASGGFSGAIILYETALGLGIAVGPLLGGVLGGISWRGPFFGVSALMAIALIATLFFLPPTPKPEKKVSLVAPLAALRHRGLLTMGMMALLYNWGFFTLLGYAPYPMQLHDPLQLGWVFFAWGILVAIFAVWGAPWAQRRFGTAPTLYVNLLGLGILLTVIGLGVSSPPVVMGAVILSGIFVGLNNTLTTQAVMLVSPVERPIASSAYGFVRFIGGGLAPFAAGKIAEATDQSVAFYVGAAAFLVAIPVLASGHQLIKAAESGEAAEPVTPTLEPVGPVRGEGRPVLVAVGATPDADEVVDRAAEMAAAEGAPLEVVHVRETDVIEEQAIDAEEPEAAAATVRAHLDRLGARGMSATGLVLHSVGDHASAGVELARYATETRARTIALGSSPRGRAAQLADGSITSAVVANASVPVVLVVPGEQPRELSAAALTQLRHA
ncbi:putative MFS family arabinose efflux permease [Nocardioides albertanoniae]|uniref:Putative MFS family arabinose efflux permease n=1 Tax=Nocardioides albertanoniae TaxID=1175486 RepID=A0A543A9D8_9ACTN|nr:MFS transporter [Nocardioides albertanoniae]TQL69228.1 putative MFS family arabinose efflux permease [Nocardioides albertanoniae]